MKELQQVKQELQQVKKKNYQQVRKQLQQVKKEQQSVKKELQVEVYGTQNIKLYCVILKFQHVWVSSMKCSLLVLGLECSLLVLVLGLELQVRTALKDVYSTKSQKKLYSTKSQKKPNQVVPIPAIKQITLPTVQKQIPLPPNPTVRELSVSQVLVFLPAATQFPHSTVQENYLHPAIQFPAAINSILNILCPNQIPDLLPSFFQPVISSVSFSERLPLVTSFVLFLFAIFFFCGSYSYSY